MSYYDDNRKKAFGNVKETFLDTYRDSFKNHHKELAIVIGSINNKTFLDEIAEKRKALYELRKTHEAEEKILLQEIEDMEFNMLAIAKLSIG